MGMVGLKPANRVDEKDDDNDRKPKEKKKKKSRRVSFSVPSFFFLS